MPKYESFTVEHTSAGAKLLDDHWPETVLFSEDLIEHADPDVVAVVGDELTVTVINGHAVYKLGSRVEDGKYEGTLLSGKVDKS